MADHTDSCEEDGYDDDWLIAWWLLNGDFQAWDILYRSPRLI